MSESRPKVLIVDDQRSMRMTLAGVIEDQGYDVVEAEDGYKAIELAAQQQFDLVLMDIKMPGIDGVQTFREIKKISPDSVVVMMTGFAVEDLVAAALDEGAFSVVYKPFDVAKVIDLVDSVLQSVLILVVDDHSADREVLSQILTDRNYRVTQAGDGNEAIRLVEKAEYDVILMDIRMPGMDGITAFNSIKELSPDARVIFITGFELEDGISRAIQAGAYPIAYKPFDVDNLLGMLDQIVKTKVQ